RPRPPDRRAPCAPLRRDRRAQPARRLAGRAPVTGVLVRYARGGGRTPADDESLEIQDGGGFEARRTVGGARVGRFARTLPGSTLRGLGSSIRAVAGADDLAIPTPR